jgi:multiple sugar transport system ATP-binding protein
VVGVRPEALSVATHPTAAPGFDATVTVTEYQGNDNFVHCRLAETELTAVVPPSTRPASGERVRLSVAPEAVYLFDPATGATLRTPGATRTATPRV